MTSVLQSQSKLHEKHLSLFQATQILYDIILSNFLIQ